tara:strand:- start:3 stop:110 length:108 start_codon:yes stop_codon:yes gene_type:complete
MMRLRKFTPGSAANAAAGILDKGIIQSPLEIHQAV